MAVTVAKTYNGMYIGDMSLKQADMILQIRGMDEVPNLTRRLYDFNVDLVKQGLNEQRSIRNILAEKGDTLENYIGTLKGYQTVGTAFMYMSPRSIIGDGVGLGKTAEIAALINFLKEKTEVQRFLIAVETSALGQTQCELIKFTGLHIVQLPSEAAKMKKVIAATNWATVDGVVMKHSALRSDLLSRWLSLYLNEDGTSRIFDTFILDESSVLKNPEAKITKYTKNICSICTRAHFMNATTFETSLLDIYTQVDVLNSNLLPSKWRIEKQYCTFGSTTYWTKEGGKPKMNFRHEKTGYKNQAEFKESLKLVYFGRCKKDIGIDIPHIYKVYEVEPTTEQLISIATGHRYMEVLNCPSLIESMGVETTKVSSPKLGRLCELVANDFSTDNVMVYCFHIEAQKAIYREMVELGRNPVILNGANTDEERWEIQSRFNTGEYDTIITNIKKSLNLHGGSVCIFYSVETNPSKLEQIRGRIDRNTSDEIKTFILLLYKGTDEYNFFMNTVKQRAKDASDLLLDSESAVNFFINSMEDT